MAKQILCWIRKGCKFLLMKRKKSLGGFWQPVCGKVESKDKSLKSAALRECKEEIGINPSQIKKFHDEVYKYYISKHYLSGRKIPKIEETVFGIDAIKSFIPTLSQEHTEFRWVSPNNALKMLKYNDNKKALRKMLKKGTKPNI